MNQIYLTDHYETFHQRTKEPLLTAPRAFSKIEHMFGHKVSLNRCKKIEKPLCIICEYHALNMNMNKSRMFINSEKKNKSLIRTSGRREELRIKFRSWRDQGYKVHT